MKPALILWYLFSFNVGNAANPVSMMGPLPKADCTWISQHAYGWCQSIYVPQTERKK